MFFQQGQNARNAVQEAEENQLEAYYLNSPPWTIAGRKRPSVGGAISVCSYHSDHLVLPPRSSSLDSPGQPISSRQLTVPRRSCSDHRRATIPARTPTDNPVWRHFKRLLSTSFGLFLLIQTYLCLGAFCFMWIEAAKETSKKEDMETERMDIINRLLNCSNASDYKIILKDWEKRLLKYPQIYLEIDEASRVWSWTFSYYCSYTIISTIGYGNVTPLSVLGRLFAVVYAIVGIPLMLLFITDIGSKFARWTKIAVIKFRKWKYGLRCRLKLRKGVERKDTDEGKDGTNGKNCETRGEDGAKEGGANERYAGFRAHSVPEVHINIAMSTMDEEVCPMEEKDIESTVLRNGQTTYLSDYKEDYLHPRKDSSDYGGSSTGVEACIADISSLNVQGPEPDVSIDITTSEHVLKGSMEADETKEKPGQQSHEGGQPRVGSPLAAPEVNDLVIESRSSDNASLSSPDEECKAAENIYTKTETLTELDGVSNHKTALDKHEPSDVLHTQLQALKTPSIERICDKCGQSMQIIQRTSTKANSRSVKLDAGFKSQKHPSLEFDQFGASRDGKQVPPPALEGSEYRKMHTGSLRLQKKLTFDLDRKRLSRKKSKSLEDISTLSKDAVDSEAFEWHMPALKNSRKRVTSAPVVRFRTDGRLPTQYNEPRQQVDDDAQIETDRDDGGDSGDKIATDSGVASSTSNSTECSPKRRPGQSCIITDCNLETEKRDHEGSEEEDVFSHDDVMDSEEEKNFEKLGRRHLRTARLSETDKKSTRVSEADIAMLSIPIWLALLLLLVYLLIGASSFASMEDWSFVDSFYYCFISLSTIGFGDLVFLRKNLSAGLIFSFAYSFIGLCFTSMCMSLSSMELTLLSRRIAGKFGIYRGRLRSLKAKRWASRRRRAIRAPSPERQQ